MKTFRERAFREIVENVHSKIVQNLSEIEGELVLVTKNGIWRRLRRAKRENKKNSLKRSISGELLGTKNFFSTLDQIAKKNTG